METTWVKYSVTIKLVSYFIAVFRSAFDDEHFDITIVNGPGSYSIEAVGTFSQYS